MILPTLQGRLDGQQVFVDGFGANASDYFSRIHRVQIVASGSSFHAGGLKQAK
jgi:glucosamine 6-phosphate synthetase-like amidotransferase/phosphosugar isomerase protein